METFDFTPMPPGEGPPLPKWLALKWPWIKDTAVSNPDLWDIAPDAKNEEIPAKEEAKSTSEQDDYVIILKKKAPYPVWLKEYQENLKQASKIAAEKTKHLRGATRVQAMNRIISEILKDGKST